MSYMCLCIFWLQAENPSMLFHVLPLMGQVLRYFCVSCLYRSSCIVLQFRGVCLGGKHFKLKGSSKKCEDNVLWDNLSI